MEPGQGEQGFASTGLTQSEQSSVLSGECEVKHPSSNSLATASLVVENAKGQKLVVKALVDSCSQTSFVASRIHQFLKLPSQKCGLLVEEMNGAKLVKCRVESSFLIRLHFLRNLVARLAPTYDPKSPNIAQWLVRAAGLILRVFN